MSTYSNLASANDQSGSLGVKPVTISSQMMIGYVESFCDYAIIKDRTILAMSFYGSSATAVKSMGAHIACGGATIRFTDPGVGYGSNYYCNSGYRDNDRRYEVTYEPVVNGRDAFVRAFALNGRVNYDMVITTRNLLVYDIYQLLMERFDLPLKSDWTDYILQRAVADNRIDVFGDKYGESTVIGTAAHQPNREINFGGQMIKLADIITVEIYSSFNQEYLDMIVSEGISGGRIKVADMASAPLDLEGGFDAYIENYGTGIVNKLDEMIHPLTGLEPIVPGLALKGKRPYPQQACCINGIVELMKNRKALKKHYGLLVEGMGVGKTIQSASAIEAYFNQKWLEKHPEKELKDCLTSGEVGYRVVVMCPGHLVEKWKYEVETEIPGAKATVVRDLAQLVELRESGKERKGKEYFILSKDFAKLSSSAYPIPTRRGKKRLRMRICSDCKTNRRKNVYPLSASDMTCPECGGHKWELIDKPNEWGRGLHTGMLCPECGELLYKYSPAFYKQGDDEKIENAVLEHYDFSGRNNGNSNCACCGTELWSVACANLNCQGDDELFNRLSSREGKWHKISFWANARKKNRKTAWVLRGMEGAYAAHEGLSEEDYKEVPEPKTRKVAPASYIKKYLKGFFDVFVADELHKYSAPTSAQGVASHALMRSADFTLGLTGTISNGTADAMFALLFRLDPAKMIAKGFHWEDRMAFSYQYGCIESVREHTDDSRNRWNSNSRGKIIQSPKVKPGISPMLYIDFMLGCAVQLDLTDLSRYIPKLNEQVVFVDAEDEVMEAYRYTVDALNEAKQSGEGMGALSEMLTFALSYTDKPYGRKPIVSAFDKDKVLANPQNFEEMADSDYLSNKEQELIDLINKEQAEGRNLFVYASFTGKAEMNVTYRLKDIIEKHCPEASGHTYILESGKGKAEDRERWIHEHAAKGMRVCICNPKVVETGLDFCFDYEGQHYNFPTLVFYQVGYELATMWQASRRAYRLNQTVECRTFYFGTTATLQQAAIEIMAKKQVATSAIQGKFSTEGLAAMAQGVDSRVMLAKALSEGDTSDTQSISNMFDVMNQSSDEGEDEYANVPKAPLYSEIVGITDEGVVEETMPIDLFDVLNIADGIDDEPEEVVVAEVEATEIEDVEDEGQADEDISEADVIKSDITDLFAFMDGFDMFSNLTVTHVEAKSKKTKKKKSEASSNEVSLLDDFASFELFEAL